MTVTQEFYMWLQMQLISCKTVDMIIAPLEDKAQAVRIANFCRNCGYKCTVHGLGARLTFWVHILIIT